MGTSKWKSCYERYRTLESEWVCSGAPLEVNRQVFNRLIDGSGGPGVALENLTQYGYKRPSQSLINEARNLGILIKSFISNGESLLEPLEDVYQAALVVERRHDWFVNHLRMQV